MILARRSNLERWRGMRSTRHLGRRLLLLYAITAVIVAAVFTTALLASWLDSLTYLTGSDYRARVDAALIAAQARERDSTVALLGALVAGDDASLAAYRQATRARQEAIGHLAAIATQPDSSELVAGLQGTLATLDTLAEQSLAARRADDAPTALGLWQRGSAPALRQLSAQFAALEALQGARQRNESAEVQKAHSVTLILTFSFAAAAALLGLWITRRVILNITRPLEALAVAAAAIGAGKLETRVAPGLSAEFDMLGGVMNTMAGHLATSRDDLRAALDATERRNRELRLLSDVGVALDSGLELDLIIERSLAIVLEAFASPAGAVVLSGDVGVRWYWGAGAGDVEAREALALAVQRELDRALPDGNDPPALMATAETVDIVVVPLIAPVRAHGMLALAFPRGADIAPRDRALLEQIGAQMARAIENVRLYIAEKGRSAEAGMLAQMAQLTSGTLDLDRLARLIARYAVQVLGVDRCIIGFFDPRADIGGRGQLQRLYQYGFRPQQTALLEDGRESLQTIVQRHMLDGQSLVVTDADSDERPEVRELARRLATRSFVSVPLVARERRVGVIYLDTREPRQHGFGPQDQRILTAIADQAAAAIDGARLYEVERRRATQLRVLNQASQKIAATAQLDDLFRSVTTTISQSFGYGAAQIGLIEGAELVFLPNAADQTEARRSEPLVGDGAAAWVVRQASPRITRTGEGTQPDLARLIVPLRTKDRVLGVLEVAGDPEKHGVAFDADDERILLALGDQLGLAIEKARLQERALALAVVEERNRLARDLHDSVTQSLFSINLTVEAARLLLRRDTEAAERQLASLSERTKETLSEMRGLIYSLRPPELEDQGLPVALKRWGERVRHEHLLPVEVLVEGGARLNLTEMQEREIFRIAQEALNNVIKHAGATRATVRLRASEAAILLLVEDDGRGFDAAAPARADAFGTRGMRERAALLGGEVAFDSRPGDGTRVLVTLPRVAPSAHTAAQVATRETQIEEALNIGG